MIDNFFRVSKFVMYRICGVILCLIVIVQSESQCCKTVAQHTTYRRNSSAPDGCPITCSTEDELVILDQDGNFIASYFEEPLMPDEVVLKNASGITCKLDCPKLGNHDCTGPCSDGQTEGFTPSVGGRPDEGGWSLLSISVLTAMVSAGIISVVIGLGCLLKNRKSRGRRPTAEAAEQNQANEDELQRMKQQEGEPKEVTVTADWMV